MLVKTSKTNVYKTHIKKKIVMDKDVVLKICALNKNGTNIVNSTSYNMINKVM